MHIGSEVGSASLPAFGSAWSLGIQKTCPSSPSFPLSFPFFFAQSQMAEVGRGPLEVTWSNPLLKPCQIEQAAQGCVQTGFLYLQG